jgi:hypothetical protein
MSELTVTLQIKSDSDVMESLYDLSKHLSQHLLVDINVIPFQNGNFVSRGTSVGAIITTLVSAGGLTLFLESVRDFLLRKMDHRVTIKVLKGENSVEFDYSPASTDINELLFITQEILAKIDDNSSGGKTNVDNISFRE